MGCSGVKTERRLVTAENTRLVQREFLEPDPHLLLIKELDCEVHIGAVVPGLALKEGMI